MPAGVGDARFWLGLLVGTGPVALAFLTRRRSPWLGLAVAWAVLSFLVVSNLIIPVGIWLAERTLYLPSVGVAIAVAGGLTMLTRSEARTRARLVQGLIVGLIAAGSWKSWTRSPVWSDSESVVRNLLDEHPELNTSLASALLAPTRIYVQPILNVVRDYSVKGIVHITGGGFLGNVPRVLPKSARARIDPSTWPRPPIFGLLQKQAELPESEMLRVFNCGIGMLLIVGTDEAEDVARRLEALGERAYRIGQIEARPPDEPALVFDEPRANPS